MKLGPVLLVPLIVGAAVLPGVDHTAGREGGSPSAAGLISRAVSEGSDGAEGVSEGAPPEPTLPPCPAAPATPPSVNGRPVPVPSGSTVCYGDGVYTVTFGKSRVRFTDEGVPLDVSVDAPDAEALTPLVVALGLPVPPPCDPAPPPPGFAPPLRESEGSMLPRGFPPIPTVDGEPLAAPFCSTIYREDDGYTVVLGSSYVKFTYGGIVVAASIQPGDAEAFAPLMEALKTPDGVSP